MSWASGGWLPSTVRGTVHHGLVGVWDWYGTLCDLAGVVPTDHRAAKAGLPPIDSVSLAPVLLGHTTSLSVAASDSDATAAVGRTAAAAAAAASTASTSSTRMTIALGTEPTDGFPLGKTVGGFIRTDELGKHWKIMVGPHHAACWTGPHFPNRTTNFEVQDYIVRSASPPLLFYNNMQCTHIRCRSFIARHLTRCCALLHCNVLCCR